MSDSEIIKFINKQSIQISYCKGFEECFRNHSRLMRSCPYVFLLLEVVYDQISLLLH
jgi:hypothetical protein